MGKGGLFDVGKNGLNKNIGRIVRIKPELLTKDYIKQHGTISKDVKTWEIIVVQKIYDDSLAYRVVPYDKKDKYSDFGKPIRPEEIEFVD